MSKIKFTEAVKKEVAKLLMNRYSMTQIAPLVGLSRWTLYQYTRGWSRIRGGIRTLPEEKRKTILQLYEEGKTHKQIHELTGVRLPVVYGLCPPFTAEQKIRRKLPPELINKIYSMFVRAVSINDISAECNLSYLTVHDLFHLDIKSKQWRKNFHDVSYINTMKKNLMRMLDDRVNFISTLLKSKAIAGYEETKTGNKEYEILCRVLIDGKSYAELGEQHGVSIERIRQIYEKSYGNLIRWINELPDVKSIHQVNARQYKYVIEKDITVPAKAYSGPSKKKSKLSENLSAVALQKRSKQNSYPFKIMKVGDSFLVDTDYSRELMRKYGTAARLWAKHAKNGWNFTSRKTEQGIRIWRIK